MPDAKPTIVLIHGAFADASGWGDVITALTGQGYTCYAPANPLRGITSDADYIRSFLTTVPGPVVLAGHSYGGAVITAAAAGAPNVTALVYIAAYAPDQGECLQDANNLGGGSSELPQHFVIRPYPGAPEGDADGYIDPAHFHRLFCAEVDEKLAAVMAAAQRPLTVSSLVTPAPEPAWKTIPSWYLVSANDQTIPPQAERAMAARARAHTIEIDSCHVAMISHPKETTDLILAATGN